MSAGFETVLLETRHVNASMSAMTVKTDRRDACGIAQLVRLGWFKLVHAKSAQRPGGPRPHVDLAGLMLMHHQSLGSNISSRGWA